MLVLLVKDGADDGDDVFDAGEGFVREEVSDDSDGKVLGDEGFGGVDCDDDEASGNVREDVDFLD